MQQQVEHLLLKAGWQDVPLALWNLIWAMKHTTKRKKSERNWNLFKLSPESFQTFTKILNIPQNLLENSPKSSWTFTWSFWNVPQNFLEHFPRIFLNIAQNFKIIKFLGTGQEIPRNPKNILEMQPWESTAAVGNAIVNAILWGIYDGKKIVAARFSMSVDFIFTTYITVDYFWNIN